MKRTCLALRKLPIYSGGEETMNMVTHIVGGCIGVLALLGCLVKAIMSGSAISVVSAAIYGISMILLYTMSSVYHGLKPCTGKKVMQVLDHCAIYLLIAGTYTPVTLAALRPAYPLLGWGLAIFQWLTASLAVTLTAIDLKKYNIFSMICYISTGWAILPFVAQARSVLSDEGFLLLFLGGIAYTVGAVLYGIGSRQKWFHSIFHIFVVLGSLFQFLSILLYVF